MLTDRMGIDIWEVIDAASTKPYGSCALSPVPVWAGTAYPSTRVSYKPGVGDIRESPSLKIISLLKDLGDVRYHDPHVPTLTRHNLHSLPLEDALADADLALIVTAHPSVDHDLVLQRSSLVVDLRGITRRSPVKDAVRL
jgi:UDP-N-acetyl-D-mannosaminuronate dehydrogenase